MHGEVTIAGPITRGHFPAPAVRRGEAHNGRPDGGDRAHHCTLAPVFAPIHCKYDAHTIRHIYRYLDLGPGCQNFM